MPDELPGAGSRPASVWRPIGILLGVVLVALAALVLLGVLAYDLALGSVPAYRLDLPGTTWTVTAMDGVALVEPRPIIAFSSDRISATASLECGVVPLDWGWDSDGASLDLYYERRSDRCESTTGQDDALLDAILGIAEWSYQSDNKIALIGTHELRLTRAR